ncbi:MAG: class I SAM-dependent methyltransferase [Parachlamydiales bacterium]|nr:class I SAM-dependent methyltransferase [Candidatus Acheromyda pituitae]
MKLEMTDSLGATGYVASSCWDGNHYAKNSGWQFHMAAKALGYIKVPTNAKMLDIGCGDGRFTKHLAELIPDGKVLGLDLSVSMLAAAQANEAPNLSFVLGDVTNLPFNNQFDRIVAFNSMHWVSEISTGLEQIKRALVPGGQVLILVAPVQVRHPIHQIINKVAKQEHWSLFFDGMSSIFSFYTLAQWAWLIEKAKMIPESLELIDASMDYPDKQSFADFITGWIPFGTIPEDKKTEYVDEVVEAYVDIIPCSNKGAVHYQMDELLIVASKAKETKL